MPTRSMEPCAEPVRRTSTKSPQVASCLRALARAHDLAAVGELDEELAPEIGDDAALDDDLLLPLAPGRQRRRAPSFALEVEQRVELRRADEVVLGQPVDGVRP